MGADVNKKLVYDCNMTVGTLLDHLERGETVHCPHCGAELVAAMDIDSLTKLKVHPGIYCSNDPSHIRVYVDAQPRSDFWDQFQK